MKRKDFSQVIQPLLPKLYDIAFSLVPDDLQSEQLVIDSVSVFLLKENKTILRKELEISDKKSVQIYRRNLFKGVLKYLTDIGARRSVQLTEQMRLTRPVEFASFYNLGPKVRLVMKLRYDMQFSVEEVGEILQIPRYEVIENIHNGRYLLLSELNKGVSV